MTINLKTIREKKGITQVELSIRSGVSRTVINQLENGERTVITSNTMFKLANSLGVKISDIFLP